MVRASLVTMALCLAVAGCGSSQISKSNEGGDKSMGVASSSSSPKRGPMSEERGIALTSIDQTFVRDAAINASYEIEASKLAVSKSEDPKVKKFAQGVIDEQTKTKAQLMKIAKARLEPLNPVPNFEQEESLKKLQGLAGAEFDREYLKQMDRSHSESIAEYKSESQWGKNEDVRSVSTRTLPRLQQQKETLSGDFGMGALGSERE